MTIMKVVNMFLKKKRKREKFKDSKKRNAVANVTLSENKNGIEIKRPFYKTCDRLHDEYEAEAR